MQKFNSKFKSDLKVKGGQSGEIATLLTLISVGLMLMGMVAGNAAVKQTTQIQSRASASECEAFKCSEVKWLQKYLGPGETPDEDKLLSEMNGASCFYLNGDCLESCIAANPSIDLLNYCKKSSTPPPAATATPAPTATPTAPAPSSATTPTLSPTTVTGWKNCWECSGASLCTDNVIPASQSCPGNSIIGTCEENKNKCASEIACMGYSSAFDCKTKTKCSTDCRSCIILGGGSGYKCPDFNSIDPTAAPNKTLCPECYVVCSDTNTENGEACESGKKGQKQLCYHECRPDRPGYSHAVYCSGEKGYEIGTIEKDPQCGEATGPAPNPGAKCTEGGKTYNHGELVTNCVEVACDGLNWVEVDKKCLDGAIVNYPGKVIPPAGNCGGKVPTCKDGRIVPTQALVNPTKTASKKGFHLGSEIFTINRDKGVEFQFNVKFYFDGCDGRILLEKNGNTIAGPDRWNRPVMGDFIYSPEWTQSPILGNGQVENITYTGKYKDYACAPQGIPDNMTDSIRCRLAVDDLGNPRVSGTGCNWKNQGEIPPVKRPKVTPKPTSTASSSNSTSSKCYQYSCPNSSGKFSVKDSKLYDNDKCSGNSTDSFNEICGKKFGSGCDIVSGGETGKGKCVDDPKLCDSKTVYDRWGPKDNQVSTLLCQGQAGKLCCEPPGGFKPKQVGTITQTPSLGGNMTAGKITEGSCEITYPNTIYANTPFEATIRAQYPDAVGVSLKFGSNEKTGPEVMHCNYNDKDCIAARPVAPNTRDYVRWRYSNIQLPAGTYNVTFTGTSGINCPKFVQITVTTASSAAAGTSTIPTDCTKVSADAIQTNCASCIDTSVGNRLGIKKPSEQVTGSCNTIQKVLSWCAGNPGECIPSRNTCVTGSACQPKKSDGSDGPDKMVLSIQSYSNDGFIAFIEGVNKGYYSAIDASLYVLNASRVPGLQRLFCDPFKYQCDFLYQNPQVGT